MTLLPAATHVIPDVWDLAAEELDPTPNPYLNDPVGWCEKKFTRGFMWSKQQEVARSVVDNRYTAVPTCFDVGKSWEASALACWWLDVHPPGTAFVVTTAPVDAQVRGIVWREIQARFVDAETKGVPLPGRITQDAQWKLDDGRLMAIGRKPSDYNQAAFQGYHALYVLVIIDEADGVPQAIFDALDGLVTNEFGRVLAIGNPFDPTSPFADACKPGSGWHTIRVSAWDTPNFTGEPVPHYLPPLLISPMWVDERRKRWGEGSPRWMSKVEGQFPKTGDDMLIEPGWLERACRTELVPDPKDSRLGLDVARYGADMTTLYLRQGGHCRLVAERAKQSTMRTAGLAAKAHIGNPYRPVVSVDDDGVGGGVVDRLIELGIPVLRCRNGAKPVNELKFKNARSEWYWAVRVALEAGEVDLDPADEDLLAQLGSVKYKLDSRGKLCIETKDEMRKRGLPSPDHADAFVYSFVASVSMPVELMAQQATGEGRSHGITDDLMDAAW